MPAFNRTFFDLNNERQYVLTNHHENFPCAVISDLKLSVRLDDHVPAITGIVCRDNIVRISIAIGRRAIAHFSADNRLELKRGRSYPLTGTAGDYSGMIVFGTGAFSEPVDFKGHAEISEECLSRIMPSAIPYVSIPCTNLKLTGNVHIGGDKQRSHSFASSLPESVLNPPHNMFSANSSFMVDLIDTGIKDETNPMIAMANGINSYNSMDEIRSPIYTIHNVSPNEDGAVFVVFADHFHVRAIVNEVPENTEQIINVSKAAVESDFTISDICDNNGGGGGGSGNDEDCTIEFDIIEPQ